MTKRALGALLLAACLGPAGGACAQDGGSAGAATVRLAQPSAARFPEVTLYAYPHDAQGALLSGLNAGAFQVTENGTPATVVRVEAQGAYLDICLALDGSLSMQNEDKIILARQAAGEFVRQLGPQDRAALVTFGESSYLAQTLTQDRPGLTRAINATAANGRQTVFLDGVYWSVSQVALRNQGSMLTGRSDARRIVLALTDGQDLGSHSSAAQVINFARANGVSICTVGLGGDADNGLLELLARETGGIYLRAPGAQDLQHLYATLAEQLHREYRIVMVSPHPDADSTRREVHVTLNSAHVSGETWYQAPGRASLLVTVPNNGAAPTGPAVTSASPAANPRLLLGVLLAVAGIAGALGGLFFWLGSRRAPLRIHDSNPRIDLLPLWVRDGSTLVGRGRECELVLDSHQVSRVHARIEAAGGIYLIFDEGSRNGTYVNGRRVRRSQELRVGDRIRFGDREFRFAGELRG